MVNKILNIGIFFILEKQIHDLKKIVVLSNKDNKKLKSKIFKLIKNKLKSFGYPHPLKPESVCTSYVEIVLETIVGFVKKDMGSKFNFKCY